MNSEAADDSSQREKALEDLLCIGYAKLRRLDHSSLVAGPLPNGIQEIGDLLSKLQRSQQRRIIYSYMFQGLIGLAATFAKNLFLAEPAGSNLYLFATLLLHLGEDTTTLRLVADSGLLKASPTAANEFTRIAIEANAIHIARQLQREFPTSDGALASYLKESELLLATPPPRECTILVVSLERDTYRRSACLRMLDGLGVSYRVVDAIGPGSVPSELSPLLPKDTGSDFSGFGNLSHFLCWRAIVEESLDFALIIEDDAVLRGHPGIAADLADRTGFDLLFVNDRLTPSPSHWTSSADFGTIPVLDALIDIAGRNPKFNAPGSDCYYLSGTAARKLVETVYAIGFQSANVDWSLLLSCIGRREAEAIPESVLRTVLSQSRAAGNEHRLLNAGTTTRPLALHRPVGVWRDTRVY